MLRISQLLGFGAKRAAAVGGGSVAYDAASSVDVAGDPTFLWTHTPVGTPSAVVVCIYWDDVFGGAVTSITYGGVSMGAAVVTKADSTSHRTSIYVLASPGSGAQAIVVTFANLSQYGYGGAITVTGSDLSTPTSNSSSANGTSTTPTSTCTSATGELVVGIAGHVGDLLTPTTGTVRWDEGYNGYNAAGSTVPGAASVAVSYSSSSSGVWTTCAVSLKAA